MEEHPWYESFFGEDYFEIYESVLSPGATAAQVEGITSLLDLRPGATVLDLACGHGRHSIELAKLGYTMTGVDLSEVFLERARHDSAEQSVDIRWIHGDMRDLQFEDEFDAVINIFTAFGYFDESEDDLRVLRAVGRALKMDGLFLIETLHRDALQARFQTRGFDKTSNGSIVLRERNWDLARDVIDETVDLIRQNGTRMRYRTSVRVRSLPGYLELMRQAGLEPEAWYGGLDGSQLELSSRRLVVIGRKVSGH